MSDLQAFRAEFPVLRRTAYLNAGTDGPVPQRAAEAATRAAATEVEEGRAGQAHFERLTGLRDQVRERVAGLLGCAPGEVAMTRSATDGINLALSALDLGPGDEVVTSDEEHPGLIAPLAGLRERRGIVVRTAPFPRLAEAVGPGTRLVACSHVSWVTGRVADTAALAATGVPVLLDGAQGLGAGPVDVAALGCDFYAAAGQKWLCGPDGSGYLYVRGARAGKLAAPWPSYVTLTDGQRAGEPALHPDARRFDMGVVAAPQAAWALAALDVLGDAGWDWVLGRGPALAAELAERLAAAGREVLPRGHSTLVAWRDAGAEGTVARLADEGFLVRDLPGRDAVRASVGAWTSEEELERLAAAA